MFYRFNVDEKKHRDEIFGLVNRGKRDEANALCLSLPPDSAILEELLEKAIRDNNVELLSDIAPRVDDINKKRFFWLRTAANLAAEMDRPDCLQKLVELNADLNVEDNDGDTPILKICGKTGNSAMLQGALQSGPTWENSIPFIGYVDLLWTCGYDINHTNKEGANAAIIAVQHGNTHLLRPLARRGIDLACQDKKGNCAIHYAVTLNQPQTVQELADLGADLNSPQKGTGDTPSHLALMNPGPDFKYACLRVLVRNGVDLNKLNDNYSSAMSFDITYPVSANELATVLRSRGYTQAHAAITEALEEGLIERPTAFESGLNATAEGIATVGGHVVFAASSTGEFLGTGAQTTGSVLAMMMPISSIAEMVSGGGGGDTGNPPSAERKPAAAGGGPP